MSKKTHFAHFLSIFLHLFDDCKIFYLPLRCFICSILYAPIKGSFNWCKGSLGGSVIIY